MIDGVEAMIACPLCGGRSWRRLAVPTRWIGTEVFSDLRGALGLVRCRGCSLVFTNPRPAADRLNAFYSGDTYSCHEVTGSASAGTKGALVLERIVAHARVDAPRTLLDYGAGGGAFLRDARDRGWTVQGFEPGRRGLESCLRAGLPVTDQLDGIPDGTFGVVTLHHVFEHLADPIGVLNGIARFLAPGGQVYIEVPNADSLRARLALPALSRHLRVDERHRAFPIHLMYYSGRTMRRTLANAGWGVDALFTLGMGLDEYFVEQDELPAPSQTPRPAQQSMVDPQRKPSRRLRHWLRDAALERGFGENLAVIASPRGRATQ